MRTVLTLILVVFLFSGACNTISEKPTEGDERNNTTGISDLGHAMDDKDEWWFKGMSPAVLASRIRTFDSLRTVVSISYYRGSKKAEGPGEDNDKVRLVYSNKGEEIVSELYADVSQNDIVRARDGSLIDKLELIFRSPYAVSNRKDLKNIYTLARWRHIDYGWKDVAFYDLAATAVEKINTPDLAYMSMLDSSELGYINTFNHITAQALITSCFSEPVADFIADVHERKNMAELVTGMFTEEQLTDPTQNPVDNYVDMINNEIGQEIGLKLRSRYGIDRFKRWTPQLLSAYLNDLQQFYSWSFGIGMNPFTESDPVVQKFTRKINSLVEEVNS